MDNRMSMDAFVASKIKSVNLSLRAIGRIRKFLTMRATQVLVQALVISKLDYANGILGGISANI